MIKLWDVNDTGAHELSGGFLVIEKPDKLSELAAAAEEDKTDTRALGNNSIYFTSSKRFFF